MNNNGPLIYSGRASISLAKSVRDELGVTLGSLRIKKFADSEPWFRVEDYKKIPGRNVYIIQSTSEYAPTTYFDLFGIMNAVQRQSPKRLVVVMPFMGFRRQERDVNGGEAVMAELMARFIIEAGATDVVLCDPHAPAIVQFFEKKIRVHLVDPNPIFAAALAEEDLSEYVVLTPDSGRETAARVLSRLLGVPLASAKKMRPAHDKSESLGIENSQSVRGKKVIIREDEVSTAGTVGNTGKDIKEAGGLAITIMATHAVLVGESVWNITDSADISKLYVTDSIYLPWEKREEGKIIVLSLAPAIAKIIREIEEQ